MASARHVHGQLIESDSAPAANLTFASNFRYAGGQRVVIDSAAEADQYFFVDADQGGTIHGLYWVQFEHRLPGVRGTYDYPARPLVALGTLRFVTDTKLFADYADTVLSPDFSRGATDQAWAGLLLRRNGYIIPRLAIRARMFYLPDSTRRSELMIIYVGALAPDDLGQRPLRIEAPGADWPELAHRVIRDAQRGLRIEPISSVTRVHDR
jgi:hypothetical protein